MAKTSKRDVVQVKNPRSGKYVKIDRSKGQILSHKKSEGPYKGIPVAGTSSVLKLERISGSPLDVPGLALDLTTEEIVESVREGRRHPRGPSPAIEEVR